MVLPVGSPRRCRTRSRGGAHGRQRRPHGWGPRTPPPTSGGDHARGCDKCTRSPRGFARDGGGQDARGREKRQLEHRARVLTRRQGEIPQAHEQPQRRIAALKGSADRAFRDDRRAVVDPPRAAVAAAAEEPGYEAQRQCQCHRREDLGVQRQVQPVAPPRKRHYGTTSTVLPGLGAVPEASEVVQHFVPRGRVPAAGDHERHRQSQPDICELASSGAAQHEDDECRGD